MKCHCSRKWEYEFDIHQGGKKGRLVLPAAVREKLGIDVGDVVSLHVEKNELRIITLESQIEQAQQRVRKYIEPGRSLSAELIAERREAAKDE